MKILVTGVVGFISFNFSNFLLQNTKHKIVGIDNLNNYYNENLKLIKKLKGIGLKLIIK